MNTLCVLILKAQDPSAPVTLAPTSADQGIQDSKTSTSNGSPGTPQAGDANSSGTSDLTPDLGHACKSAKAGAFDDSEHHGEKKDKVSSPPSTTNLQGLSTADMPFADSNEQIEEHVNSASSKVEGHPQVDVHGYKRPTSNISQTLCEPNKPECSHNVTLA